MPALIFYLSSIPQLPTPPGPFSDKHFHGGVVRAARGAARARARLGALAAASPRASPLRAFLLATLYGATDEFHQLFVPGRTAAFDDLAADALGAAAAAGLLLAWAIIRRQRRVA